MSTSIVWKRRVCLFVCLSLVYEVHHPPRERGNEVVPLSEWSKLGGGTDGQTDRLTDWQGSPCPEDFQPNIQKSTFPTKHWTSANWVAYVNKILRALILSTQYYSSQSNGHEQCSRTNIIGATYRQFQVPTESNLPQVQVGFWQNLDVGC